MRRCVAVIRVHAARRFSQAHVFHAVRLINGGKVGAANRPILVEKKLRTKNASVVVEFLRFFQVANRFVDPAVLFVFDRRIKPWRRIFWIQLFGSFQFEPSLGFVAVVAEGFAKIAVKKGAVWFKRGRYLKIPSTIFVLSLANQTETAAQPCVAQRAIDRHRILECTFRLIDSILCAVEKPEERMCGRVAGRQLQSFFQRFLRLWHASEAEMQFSNARPGESE